MGAVVGVILLFPAVVAFVVDRMVQRRQVALLSARAVPLRAEAGAAARRALFGFCTSSAASSSQSWPCRCGLRSSRAGRTTSAHAQELRLRRSTARLGRFRNSLELASWTAVIGTDRLVPGRLPGEKTRGFAFWRGVASPVDDAARGAGSRAGARLHLLLQRAGQSARLHLRDDGDPRVSR